MLYANLSVTHVVFYRLMEENKGVNIESQEKSIEIEENGVEKQKQQITGTTSCQNTNVNKKRTLDNDGTNEQVRKELKTENESSIVEEKKETLPNNGGNDDVILTVGEVEAMVDSLINDQLNETDEDAEDAAAVLGDCSETECSYKEARHFPFDFFRSFLFSTKIENAICLSLLKGSFVGI